ncbi:MAG: CHAD domain-containing protein [Vicinamibacterales bacterium]
MAFHLRKPESTAHGLRRLAKKELRRAREELRRTSPPGDPAIHEARKSLKKVRAILELFRQPGGKAPSRKRLGSVNHTLSRLRDADAMVVTLGQLQGRHPHLFSEHTFARVHRQLIHQKRAAMRDAEHAHAWKKVDRDLRKVEHAARHWRSHDKGFGALASGFRSNYRDGRDAMERALETQRAADFHEWRKQIKMHWYALRLIESAGPEIRRDIAALHRAETALGDEHNVVVLCGQITQDASICRGPIDIDRVRRAANRYQCALRKKAIANARRIYRRTPRRYVRSLKRAWTTWRRHRLSPRDGGLKRAAA